MIDIMKVLLNNTTCTKRSILQKIADYFRNRKGKRNWEQLKKAKREEKAALALANADKALQLEAQADKLILESALCAKIDPEHSERLLRQAQDLMSEASSLKLF